MSSKIVTVDALKHFNDACAYLNKAKADTLYLPLDGNIELTDAQKAELKGDAGNGIKQWWIKYTVDTQGVTIPHSGWSSDIPSVSPGQYLWTRIQFQLDNNDADDLYCVSRNGETGTTFTPSVNGTGLLSWTNDKGLENPASVNTTGPRGATGSPANVVELTDQNLNDYTYARAGWYYGGGGNTVTNKPVGVNAFFLEIVRSAGGWTTQIMFPSDSQTNTIWMRSHNGFDSTWTQWTEKGKTGETGLGAGDSVFDSSIKASGIECCASTYCTSTRTADYIWALSLGELVADASLGGYSQLTRTQSFISVIPFSMGSREVWCRDSFVHAKDSSAASTRDFGSRKTIGMYYAGNKIQVDAGWYINQSSSLKMIPCFCL